MDWITTKDAAAKWGLTVRRVQAMCDKGKVLAATKLGDVWAIPKDAPKPLDGRTKEAKTIEHKRVN